MAQISKRSPSAKNKYLSNLWKFRWVSILIVENIIFTLVSDPKYIHISDEELLEKFYRHGDNQWLGALMERYTLLLYGVCKKYLKDEEEAKDCVQQIFLKVIGEIRKYRVDFFKSWLYSVARTQCLMRLRERQRLLKELTDKDPKDLPGPSPYDAMAEAEKETVLSFIPWALAALNEPQRVSVRLFYLEKKTYQEIAAQTGYSLSEVKSNIQNGKRNLRIIMENKFSRL
jgi:RNA polymerase sigma factor (sigma-70 family)